jgi:hypothetical protein
MTWQVSFTDNLQAFASIFNYAIENNPKKDDRVRPSRGYESKYACLARLFTSNEAARNLLKELLPSTLKIWKTEVYINIF